MINVKSLTKEKMETYRQMRREQHVAKITDIMQEHIDDTIARNFFDDDDISILVTIYADYWEPEHALSAVERVAGWYRDAGWFVYTVSEDRYGDQYYHFKMGSKSEYND